VGEIVVVPDVDDLVEGADLGVEEAGQLGVLLAVLVGLPRTASPPRQASGLDLVGADPVDYGGLLSG
jgi:hypothetical protein